jgi:hypothetical protein
MAVKISCVGSSGNNDARTAESSERSGRVPNACGNTLANAAIRTGTNQEGDLQNGQRRPPDVRATSRATTLDPDLRETLVERPRHARPSATRSWFEDDGAAAAFPCLRERFRGSCERIGGSDVDVELALRERRGEQA